MVPTKKTTRILVLLERILVLTRDKKVDYGTNIVSTSYSHSHDVLG